MARLPRNVYRRGECYYLRVTIRGEETRKSLGSDLTEARRLAKLHVARLKGARSEREEEPFAKTAAAVEHWLEHVAPQTQLAPRTRKVSRWKLQEHFLPTVPPLLADLRLSHLRAIRAVAESRGVKPSTVAVILAGVHSFLNWCASEGLIDRVPWEKGLVPKLKERPPDRLEDEAVSRILVAASEPHRALIRLSLLTGLRRGELIQLQWRHVVSKPRPALIIESSKTGRVRRVPLVPEAIEVLRDLRSSTSSVFVSPIRSGCADRSVQVIARRIGGGFRWHWHQLRHTFACRYLEAGGRLAALQRIMGHTTSRMTERYAALSDEAVMDDAARIGAEFRSDPGTHDGTGSSDSPGRDRQAEGGNDLTKALAKC